jgi:DNA-binding CsgD family transcriptional regulator
MEQPVDDASGVHGRAPELGRIGLFLDEVATGPAGLLIEGAAGIGKTTLWSAGIEMAQTRGWWVLTCRPVESEVPLSFSALSDLIEHVPTNALVGLPGPQRRALDVALLRAEPDPEPPDQRAVAVALLGVIQALAETSPVVVGVDDLPWVDGASAAVLEYALRRLTTQRAGLLATIPQGAATPASLKEFRFPPGRAHTLQVGPLGVDALSAMLHARVGAADRWPEVMEVLEASGGNPFFALELAAAVGASGRERGPGQPLPVPGTLLPLVQRRLHALPRAGRDVALTAAAAANPTVAVVLDAACDSQLARDGLDSAEAAGVLLIVDDRVRFTHPLLRSVHYASATDRERRLAHRRLAEVTSEFEGQARHLALAATGPDEHLARRLAAAAQTECLRGAAVAGAELADLAIKLTPPDEPATHVWRLIEAGRLHLAAFDPDGARERLEAAVELSEPGQVRATALHQLARVVGYLEGVAASIPLGRQALGQATDGTELKALMHRDLAFALGVSTANFGPATMSQIREAFALADRIGEEGLDSQLMAFQAMAEFVGGGGVRHDLIERALNRCDRAGHVPMEVRPRILLSHIRRSADDLRGARALLTEEYSLATEHGAETDLPFLVLHLVELETWAGNFELAEQYCDHGYQVATAVGAPIQAACMYGARAMMRAFCGPLQDARSDAQLAIDGGLRSGVLYPALLGGRALGLVELVSGNPAAAHAVLAPITERVAWRELVDPGWIALRSIPDDVESLIRLGDLHAAGALLASVEERAERLNRASAQASGARCRALLASAQGEHDVAARSLRLAFAAHERLEMPLDLARTHLVAGEVARRARRKATARDHMETARSMFDQLGARPWAKQAEADLSRLGTRRARGPGLTSAERRVAGLVASGLTNREVAARLYMGRRTVEAHLSSIYRKLGIRSRSELARDWNEAAS